MLSRFKQACGLKGQLTAADLRLLAARFRERLDEVKRGIAGVPWYPYSSFGLFELWPQIAAPERQRLLALAGDAPVLDVGCGDGDLAFFLESLGCTVEMVDNAETNFNGLRGAAALKAALESPAAIRSVDLDAQFGLPRSRYGLMLCLGVLYHLKNPFALLEALAEAGRYCLLSTRVAGAAPAGETIAHLPVAYLLGAGEANRDWTNYWIFSETGLRRLVERTGWEVLDWHATATATPSDPAAGDRDQRVYCLLRSRAFHGGEIELGAGWHELEEGRWRWTARRFSVRCETGARLRLEFELPAAVMPAAGTVTLQAAVNGVPAPAQEYDVPGRHVFELRLERAPADVVFTLGNLGLVAGDGRQLGVIVPFFPCAGLSVRGPMDAADAGRES